MENINLEKSDEKGMLNVNTIRNYLDKATEAVCKIILPNRFGSGFFCQIPYLDIDNGLFLITCYHVLENHLDEKKIKIIINKDPKSIILEQRKIWANKDLDFVCLEIKEKEDEIHSFFQLDKNIFDKNYLKEKVLTFGINKDDKELGFSNGLIKKTKNPFFEYTCNTTPGCSGGCIVRQNNNCVIGIHRGEKRKGRPINKGTYIKDVIISIKYDVNNLIGENKINPKLLNPQNLLLDSQRKKLYDKVVQKILIILNKESNDINVMTSKQLREFDDQSYYNEKLTEFNILFDNIIEEDYHQFKNDLRHVIPEVKEELKSFFIDSIYNIVQIKCRNTIIYPKNITELLEEQKISNLTIGKEYELYFNLKAYKVLALNDNKVTLPGLTVEKQKIHNEENGSNKNIVRESTYLNAEFDPNSMEIILSDNTISYSKDSHIGGPRGFLLLQRNHYIDDYYNKIIIILPENFEFDILEGNKLSFVKNSYCNLAISVNYNETIKNIDVGQSGNIVISKISVKPKL